MPTRRFSTRTADTLRPAATRVDYFDEAANVPGFGLRVSPQGRRTWFLMYRNDQGHQKRHTLGTTPPMGLSAARLAARTALLNVQVTAADPAAAKRARRSAETFEQLADRYVEEWARPQKRSWRDDARQLRTMCLPRWKTRAVDDITHDDIRQLLSAIAKKRSGHVANRLRSLLSKVFRWANRPAVVAGLPRLAKEITRDRELSPDEIRAFWQRLADKEADGTLLPPIALWMRLRLLTGQRGGSIASMKWADVNLTTKVWEIPAADMKGGKSHIVPLSTPVVELKARRTATEADERFVLQGGRSRRIRLGIIDAMDLDNFRPHDLRRTCATGMARARVPRFVVARVLGHINGSVTGIYDRYEYLDEKRVALDTWGRVLTGIVANEPETSSVVPFTRSVG